MDIFKRLNVEDKLTVVMVTHEEDFMSYADKVVRIHDGVIIDLHVQGDKVGVKSKAKTQKSVTNEKGSQRIVPEQGVAITEALTTEAVLTSNESEVVPVKRVRKITKKIVAVGAVEGDTSVTTAI
jgi:ABC-type methionine transport system ATPase subunit